MDVFGSKWTDHWNRIREDWIARVSPEDIVLIPGDISWAMQLEDARVDLDSIGSLPGKKVMIRGNHDYWWSSLSKVKSILPSSVQVLQNNSLVLDGYTFCGTRGWINPGMKDFGVHDAKIFSRELQRLKLSLDSAVSSPADSSTNKAAGDAGSAGSPPALPDKEIPLGTESVEAGSGDVRADLIVLLHYPPFDDKGQAAEVVKLLEQYKPSHVVYGHLHGEGTRYAFEGMYDGTMYHLVSCDHLDFRLKQIL